MWVCRIFRLKGGHLPPPMTPLDLPLQSWIVGGPQFIASYETNLDHAHHLLR